MISKEKHKHDKIAKPAPIPEWAILGTTCEEIKKIADEIIKGLSNSYKVVFADASHDKQSSSDGINERPYASYISHSHHKEILIHNSSGRFNIYDQIPMADVILFNGNHYKAKAQILVTDTLKHESLKKHLNDLTNVKLVLIKDETPLPNFITDALPDLNKVVHLNINETEKIIDFIKSELHSLKPQIYGLVLAGGKSVRLGQDKTMLKWHGTKQREYVYELLKLYCNQTYISQASINEKDEPLPVIKDSFTGLGPYGGILSAMREHPDKAWMVVACDLPLFDQQAVQQLIQGRNPSSMATTFESPFDCLPEPLAAIWEPKAYPILLQFLSKGYSCPRKVMIQNEITLLKSHNPLSLKNVNTPEDLEEVKALLNLQASK